MLFNSYEFIFVLLPVTLIGYFVLNKYKHYTLGKLVLIASSLVFYGYFNPSYLWIMLTSIVLNFLINKALRKVQKHAIRKAMLAGGLVANIAILFYFKYFNFLIFNLNAIASTNFQLINVVLPLGISFFTFQQLSYLVDSYRGDVPDYSFISYTLFVAFFPQLVAGPIVLHGEMVPQFDDIEKKAFNYASFGKGIEAFSIGLAKKVLIADNFGKIVDYGFGNIPSLNSFEAIMTILAYTIQIYFDFSGYCDMATGIAWMFNIQLPQNFNSPYKARDISEFWKRWHMTLTRFLTKYVYIPLGGNRKGAARTYINIFIVFLASGIWHGAGYTFILWGALHGIAQVVNRLFKKSLDKIPFAAAWFLNFIFINVTWVYFRAPSIADAHALLGRIFSGGFGINATLTHTLLQPVFISVPAQFLPLVIVVIAFTVMALAIALFAKNTNERVAAHRPNVKTWIVSYILLVCCVLSLSSVSSFLYFNF